MSEYCWAGNIGIGSVAGNVWSRSVRRKTQNDPSMDSSEDVVKLGFRISVVEMWDDLSQVVIEWRIGVDVVLFESFCGKVKSIVQQSHQ